jgi:hypothetical protein
MSEPRWAQHDERRDYDNHPEGREDVGNRAMRDFYSLFGMQHNDDGTHKLASTFLEFEENSYIGAGAQTVTLTNTDLDIDFLMIAAATGTPVLKSRDMWNTKIIGASGFTAGLITDMTTTGQFSVGNNNLVSGIGTVYYYSAFGTRD